MKEHREQIGVTDGTTYGRTELGTVESYTLLCYFTKKHHQSRRQAVVTREMSGRQEKGLSEKQEVVRGPEWW